MVEKESVWDIEKLLDNKWLLHSKEPLITRYTTAVYDQEIIDAMEFALPPIEDISDKLPLSQGKVYALRMDLNPGVDNHKKHVVGWLILRNILDGFITEQHKKTLTDGGNFNSAKALRYYTEKFDLQWLYIMSRLFPDDIINFLKTDQFNIERAPKDLSVEIEREFYGYLYAKFQKDSSFRNSHIPLWHARHWWEVMKPFGEQIANALNFTPDYLVSGLWAWTSLEWVQMPIKATTNAQIVIAENIESPLFAKMKYTLDKADIPHEIKITDNRIFNKIEWVPHLVIGPHYDAINPLLSQTSQNQIDIIMQYDENNRQSISKYVRDKDMPVWNSTAANLACATTLANRWNIVMTIIYEPRRFFYEKKE